MPAYNYKCPQCGHEEERIVSLDERDKQFCSKQLCFALIDGETGALCGIKLEREEIALTARMPDAWKC